MEVISHTLLPEQILDLREQFAKFDIRQTGEISVSDMKKVLADTQSITLEDIQYIFQGVDLDGGDAISYHEFLAATISYKTITEQNLKTAFETMSHHNDFITRNDVENLLGIDGNVTDVEEMFTELNLSPSAKITFQQFREIMNDGIASPAGLVSPYRSSSRKKIFFEYQSPDGSTAGLTTANAKANSSSSKKTLKTVIPILEEEDGTATSMAQEGRLSRRSEETVGLLSAAGAATTSTATSTSTAAATVSEDDASLASLPSVISINTTTTMKIS